MSGDAKVPVALTERIEARLRQLAPHMNDREQVQLLREALSALRAKPRMFPTKRALSADLAAAQARVAELAGDAGVLRWIETVAPITVRTWRESYDSQDAARKAAGGNDEQR